MSVAVCQFDSEFKQPQKNMQKVSQFLAGAEEDFDLLVLPEMAFTGYCFESPEDVDPYAEDVSLLRSQVSDHKTMKSDSIAVELDTTSCYSFVQSIALRFQCMVICGFPEKVIESSDNVQYYNSVYVMDKEGQLLHVYRKHFLYTTDKAWSQPGESFLSFDTSIGDQDLKLGVGICMDINPFDFVAPWNKFEWANYHKKHKSQLIVLSANWLDNTDDKDILTPAQERREVISSQTYWLQRLEPLLDPEYSDCYFICANRTGREKEVKFCGSSCVMSLGNRPGIYLSFGRKEEGLQVVPIPWLAPTVQTKQ